MQCLEAEHSSLFFCALNLSVYSYRIQDNKKLLQPQMHITIVIVSQCLQMIDLEKTMQIIMHSMCIMSSVSYV